MGHKTDGACGRDRRAKPDQRACGNPFGGQTFAAKADAPATRSGLRNQAGVGKVEPLCKTGPDHSLGLEPALPVFVLFVVQRRHITRRLRWGHLRKLTAQGGSAHRAQMLVQQLGRDQPVSDPLAMQYGKSTSEWVKSGASSLVATQGSIPGRSRTIRAICGISQPLAKACGMVTTTDPGLV